MKSDEGIFKMLSKSSIIRNQYENVILFTLIKILKGQCLLPFFYVALKIYREVSVKFYILLINTLIYVKIYDTKMNIIFGKQIGFVNYFYRGIIIKIFKNFFKKKFLYNTSTNKKYYIYKWDLSGHEVFMTQCFNDWGNEYLFLDSIKKRKKGIFLDVGCHTGFFSVLFNDYFENTIGFEPSKKCIGALKNIKKKFNNFEYHNYFVGKDEYLVDSYDYSSGYAFGVNEKNMHHKIISKNEIKKIKIDKFCSDNQIKKVTGIKIDVDGFDFDVLQGAEKIIKKDRPSVMIELYSKELINFFSKYNYEMFTFSSTKQKPYNLKLEKLDKFINNKWIKMVCCIPKEYSNNYRKEFFKGNYFFGINKKKILNYFNFTDFKV